MPRPDFPALEREILEFWERERCFERLREQNAGGPTWSFLDGPITANNPMGVHHAWGRTYKDLFQRWFAMNGHELRYQNGFDCQGLWVEVEVEKELGFKTKRDIEEYGVDRFVEKCKQRVLKYADIQSKQSIRLGYWMDWDDSYFTMSDENNYTIWAFLKKCHERGFLYHGFDSMPWCPRCGTGISQHEIHGEDRPLVVHDSPTVRLPIRGRDDEYLLIWTTTPWTLTSNVACAVHPELVYAKVRQGDACYWLVEELVEKVMGAKGDTEIVERLPGERLVGWSYDGPFDELPPLRGVEHTVIPWKEVSAAEGTGIVHIAPGCGKEDHDLGREFGLAVIGPIDEAGNFDDGFGPFSGRFAGDVAEQVFDSLRDKGLLYRVEKYEHAYPICWRCKTQLLFRLVDEWYISMGDSDPPSGLRKEIIEVTRQTEWIPAVGQQLEIEWLLNMHDWMISKKRYWGLALPIYRCEACDSFEVIGSKEELERRAVAGWEAFEGHSPHRPWIDAVRIACSGCGEQVARIPDVGNPWLDAGIVPYSTLAYNTDRAYWEKWFPADWISESFPGQFRNWFYAILAMSTVMENRPPFKLMFGYRLMKDEHGDEMHKSAGNAIEFNEAAEREGADAMRWLYASHNPEYDLLFGWNKIHDARREFLVLWNVYSFFLTYAGIDGFDPATAAGVPVADRPDLDRWILARAERLVGAAHTHYPAFAVHLLMREVKSFIDALSRWYLRRSRRRFWKSDDDDDKLAAYRTLHEALVTVVEVLAPVIPFATERMYQELVRAFDDAAPVSVHLRRMPKPGAFPADPKLLEAMDDVLALVETGHAARNNAGVKVRQPLATLRVVAQDRRLPGLVDPFLPLLEDELNIKRVEFLDDAGELASTELFLDGKVAGPKYQRLLQPLKAALAAADADAVARRVEAGLATPFEVEGQTIDVPAEEIVVQKSAAPGWAIAEGAGLLVGLDTRLDDDLVAEGHVRDLVRSIQNLRKEIDLQIDDRIRLTYAAPDELAASLEAFRDYVAGEVLAVAVERGQAPLAGGHAVGVAGHDVELAIERVGGA